MEARNVNTPATPPLADISLMMSHYVMVPLLKHAMLSESFSISAVCSQVSSALCALDELHTELADAYLSGSVHAYEELFVIVTDEYEVCASPLLLLGTQHLARLLCQVDTHMASSACKRAVSLLRAFPELYGTPLFDRLHMLWLRVDSLVLVGDRYRSPTFGLLRGGVLAGSISAGWQKVLLDFLSMCQLSSDER